MTPSTLRPRIPSSGVELQACSYKASCSAVMTQPSDKFELVEQVPSRNPGYISPTTTEGGATDTSTFFRDVGFGGTSSSGATMIAPKASQGYAVADDTLLMDFLSSFWADTDGAGYQHQGQKKNEWKDADAYNPTPMAAAIPQASLNAADSIHACTDGNVEVSRDGGCLFDMSSDKSFSERGDVAADEDGKLVGRPSAASLCVTDMGLDDISVLTEVITLDLPEVDNNEGKRKKRSVLKNTNRQEEESAKTNPVPPTIFAGERSCKATFDELERLLEQTKTRSCQALDYILNSDAVAYVTNTPVYERLFKPSLRSASSSGSAMKRVAVAKQRERKTLKQSHTKITAFVYYEKRQERNTDTHDDLFGDERDDLEGRNEPEQRKDILLVGDDEEREAASMKLAPECRSTGNDNETPAPPHQPEIDFAPSASIKQARVQSILREGTYQPRHPSLDGVDTAGPISKAVRSTRSTGTFRDPNGIASRNMRPSHKQHHRSTREKKKKEAGSGVVNGHKRLGSKRSSSSYLVMV